MAATASASSMRVRCLADMRGDVMSRRPENDTIEQSELDRRLDLALEESFPASDPPVVFFPYRDEDITQSNHTGSDA